MSWQSYIDTQLVGTGAMTTAAIHGLDGNPWATSPALAVRFFPLAFFMVPPPGNKLGCGFVGSVQKWLLPCIS